MTRGGALCRGCDRLVTVALMLFVVIAIVAAVTADTGASFTASSANTANTLAALSVQPPASQSAAISAPNGVVNLAWTATPTAPGAGHTLSYLVLRGPVGGPYSQVASTSSLAWTDTPAADGTYEYVIRAQVSGGGSFTSGNSAARSGISDRLAPTMTVACNGAACGSGWYTVAVSVTVSGTDAGTGMGSVTRSVDGGAQAQAAGASVTFTVSGDSAGHTVQYSGADAAGNASVTSSQTIRIDATPPTAPGSVSAVSSTGGGNQQNQQGGGAAIDVTWSAASDATSGVAGYELRWTNAVTSCPAASPAAYPNLVAVGSVAGYTVNTLTAGSAYCVYLVAIDAAGNRSASSAVAGPATAQ